jgi:hypothetical protein
LDIENLIDKFAEKKANLEFEVLFLDPILQFRFFGQLIFVDFSELLGC